MDYYTYSYIKNSRKKLKPLMSKVDRQEVDKWLKKKKKKSKKRRRKERDRVPQKYSLYIKSKHWTKRKNQYWQTHSKVCYRCQSTKWVQLHHLQYKVNMYGKEPDSWFVPMCKDCHFFFHDMYGTKQDMRKEMEKFDKEWPFVPEVNYYTNREE